MQLTRWQSVPCVLLLMLLVSGLQEVVFLEDRVWVVLARCEVLEWQVQQMLEVETRSGSHLLRPHRLQT
jgi:hypothetical protein